MCLCSICCQHEHKDMVLFLDNYQFSILLFWLLRLAADLTSTPTVMDMDNLGTDT